MFKKILVALDGSDHAHEALEVAIKLAGKCDSELILFNAMQVRSLRADYEEIVTKSARKAYEKVGKLQQNEILSRAEKLAKDQGLTKVDKVSIEGEPSKSILKAAKKKSVNLIIVGTRGLTGLREIALGSVARKVTTASKCPVLVVK